MRELLESLERAGQSIDGPTRDDLAAAMREAQQAYLRTALGMARAPEPAVLRELREHADFLDLSADEVGPDQATDARFVAGTIYEWLSRLEPTTNEDSPLTRGPVGDLMKASLAYSSGDHEASSALAAQRALTTFETFDDEHPVFHAAARLILRFLARRFPDAIDAYVTYSDVVRAHVRNPNSGATALYRVGLVSRVAEAAATMSAGMLSGSEPIMTAALDQMRSGLAAAIRSGDRDLAALFDRLAAVMEGMARRSAYRVLLAAGFDRALVRHYAAQAPELWSSQVGAIERGFLRPDSSFVLSLPTGAGKTFLAQLRILSALAAHPDRWVAYIAPTRALVREVHRELGDALRPHRVQVRKIVASAEVAVLADEDELPTLTRPRTCIVLTPERLDVYLRAQPELAASCGLIIVDEAHQLGDPGRGARLEALISLVLTKWQSTRLVLLSAFLPNGADLASWLGDRDAYYRSTTRPTRQLRGLCVRYGEEDLGDQYVYRERRNVILDHPRATAPSRTYRRRRRYRIGAVLASSPADLRADTVAIPNLAEGFNWVDQPAHGRPKEGLTGLVDLSAQVGASLASHPGLVLMFLTKTSWAQSCAERIAATLPDKPNAAPYRDAAAVFLTEDHPLVRCLGRGVAYHTARLPEEAQRVVEAAARAGHLDVLCATATVQAGVNLPASIVVAVGDPVVADGPNPSFRDFSNMAGRAGRPRHDTEGVALYLPPALTRRRDFGAWARQYVLPADDAFAVESSLADELHAIMRDPVVRPLEDLSDTLQQVLLGLWAAEIRTEPEVAGYLARTFAVHEAVAPLPEILSQTMADAAAREPAEFPAYSRTALPYATCRDLRVLVDQLREASAREDWAESPSRQAGVVGALVARAPYFATKVRALVADNADADLVGDLMALWVDGADYLELASTLAERVGSAIDVPKAINAIHNVTGYIAWGVGSLLAIANAAEPVPSVRLLPYLIRFGVSNQVAAYLRLIGVTDRVGSIALAAAYPDDADVDLAAVEAWSRSPEARQAIRVYYGEDRVSRETTEVDLGFGNQRDEFVPFFVRLEGTPPTWTHIGHIVNVDHDQHGWHALDLVGGRAWDLREGQTTGIAAVTEIAPDYLTASLVRPGQAG